VEAPNPELQAVVARLDRIERENRRLKRLGSAGLALMAAVAFMGVAGPTPDTIEARKFIAVDANGEPRAIFGVAEAGPTLGLIDKTGRTRVGLIVTDESAGLSLFGTGGGPQLELEATSLRTYIGVHSPSSQQSIGLATGELPTGSNGNGLILRDGKGQHRAILGLIDGAAALALLGEDQGARVQLQAKGTAASVHLYDEKGQKRAALTKVNEVTGLLLSDKQGQGRAVLIADEKTSALGLYGRDGKSTFSAP
jgi:hypothetical protein